MRTIKFSIMLIVFSFIVVLSLLTLSACTSTTSSTPATTPPRTTTATSTTPLTTAALPSLSRPASPSVPLTVSPSASAAVPPAVSVPAGASASPSASAAAASGTSGTITSSATGPSVFTVGVATKTGIGTYLINGSGMTLYYYTNDTAGKSNASSAIIANWPVFYTAQITIVGNLNSTDFGTITRSDGSKQTTYKGYPLYTFINDKTAGDTNGQGVGGVWFVVLPANFPPSPSPSVGATTSSSGSSGSSGSGY